MMSAKSIHFHLIPLILAGLLFSCLSVESIVQHSQVVMNHWFENRPEALREKKSIKKPWERLSPDSSMKQIYSGFKNHQIKLQLMKLDPVSMGQFTWSTRIQWKVNTKWNNWIKFHHELESGVLGIQFEKMKISTRPGNDILIIEEQLAISGRNL